MVWDVMQKDKCVKIVFYFLKVPMLGQTARLTIVKETQIYRLLA